MIERGALPELVASLSPGTDDGNTYYGLNVSSNIGLEPIDQLDGFLVASYIQKSDPQKYFYPYIAGVYNVLNARSPDEALKVAAKKQQAERQKKKLLCNLMSNLGISGQVLTTCDMWDDEDYWKIVDRLFSGGIYDALPQEQRARGTITLASFPCQLLGRMKYVTGKIPKFIESGSLYVPVEVAEAIWLREKYGVGWKIGPFSEEIYDNFIIREGIGIVRLRQPKALENGIEKEVMPYIGKSTQPLRITFSDTEETLGPKCIADNPSFSEAIRLADAFDQQLDGEARDYIQEINRLISLGKNS